MVPFASSRSASGTGTLLQSALQRWPQATFVATEPAPAMINLARARLSESGIDVAGRVEFVVSTDAQLAAPGGVG